MEARIDVLEREWTLVLNGLLLKPMFLGKKYEAMITDAIANWVGKVTNAKVTFTVYSYYFVIIFSVL